MKQQKALLWLIFCISTFIFAFGVSWQINKSVNFSYSFWYETLHIKDHINEFAPQNKYGRSDFIKTSKDQHIQLFEQVVMAINHDGQGLNNIKYQVGQKQKKLFTPAETIHLKDVSTLVTNLTMVWLVNLVLFFSILLLYLTNRLSLPSLKTELVTSCMVIITVTLTFIMLGFKKIFYYFHTLVFPDNHQWFFYYQESLMSTFMKAPDLFAAISVNLSVLTIIFFVLIYYLNHRVASKNN